MVIVKVVISAPNGVNLMEVGRKKKSQGTNFLIGNLLLF